MQSNDVLENALTDRLLRAHEGNPLIEIMRDECQIVVQSKDPHWRIFLGYGGLIDLVCDDDGPHQIELDEVLIGGWEDLGWYHDVLVSDPVRYAERLLDKSGLPRRRDEVERMTKTLAAVTRRQTFAAAREMAAAKHRKLPNFAFAMSLFGLGTNDAHEICREMGVDPQAMTATRFDWPMTQEVAA